MGKRVSNKYSPHSQKQFKRMYNKTERELKRGFQVGSRHMRIMVEKIRVKVIVNSIKPSSQ